MTWRAVAVVVLGPVVAMIGACGEDDPAPMCVAGQQISCACPGGADDVQVCLEDGSGYDACECGGDGGGGGAGTGGAGGNGAGGDGACGCGDNDPCNGLESCGSAPGECAPGVPLDVDDNNLCTMDVCYPDATTGEPIILHPAYTIDDGDPCTIDQCHPTGGEQHVPDEGCDGVPP